MSDRSPDEETAKKKKRSYKFILKFPAEKLTGWQEVTMDIDKLGQSLEAAQQARGKA